MSEEPLSGKVKIRAQARLRLDGGINGPTEYFVELPNGELQPISEEDAHDAIARSPQMARIIEMLMELGSKRISNSEGNADDTV